MSAGADGGVHEDLSGLRPERRQYFVRQNRHVTRFAAGIGAVHGVNRERDAGD